MVASNTLQRYPETFDLAASAVNAALRGATVDGVDLFAEVRFSISLTCALQDPNMLYSLCLYAVLRTFDFRVCDAFLGWVTSAG